MASAFASHNSRGTACVDSPAFGVIDLIIAGAAAGGIALGDSSPGYYTIPGVFGVSGLVGIAFAARCAGDPEPAPGRIVVVPANNTAPSLGDAPVDPTLRDATPEERGLPTSTPPAIPATLRIDHNGIPTTLPPVAPTTPPVAPTAPPIAPTTPPVAPSTVPEPAAPTCTISPRTDCPDHYYCQLERENHGVCMPIP